MSSPRVFLIRHGETEWSLNGRHTGVTDIPLTANGEKRIIATGQALVGEDRLIVPSRLAHVFVSPRTRARRTMELLTLNCRDALPWQAERRCSDAEVRTEAKVTVTEDVREWDYGEYEGITSAEIRQRRSEHGLGGWDIWRDGCPGGESPEEITTRLDRLIAQIRSAYHAPAMSSNPSRDASESTSEPAPTDVLIVAHGHILRALAMRWVGKALAEGPTFLLEAGGVGTLSYEHGRVEEPAILLGGAFMVDVVERGGR